MRPLLLALLLASTACDCGGDPPATDRCRTTADCSPGAMCVDGRCVATVDAGSMDGGPVDAGAEDDGGLCPAEACAGTCCDEGERCRFDRCVPDLGACTTGDDCWSDSYCNEGACVPWEIPPDRTHDEMCTRTVDIDALVPVVQCRWTGPPAGDGAPDHIQVMSTPLVVDLDLDDDRTTLAPSIVFTSFPTSGYGNPGVLRVVDGATCEQQLSFADAADAVMSPASPAVGDLDEDGHPEIVAAAHGGGLVAFGWDATSSTYARVWRSAVCDAGGGRTPDTTGGGDQWGGPSIHDLDDDAIPEIIYGATVYGADGCVRSSTFGYPAYHRGVVPVVADVDEDGVMELVFGSAIYQWDAAAGDLVAESYFDGTALTHGQVAVADFGDYPLASLGGEDRAEVVVISAGAARVQTLEGTVLFGPIALPGGGTGGPPTIADFDGDGRNEFASAGGSQYIVFDLDCLAGGDPAGCGGVADTDGILWTQPSQDASSNVTGSSVFDFDADGSAEAVYADECYLRIYDGATGTVRFSAARSSGTTYENPVIADVDGDFHSEIVSSVNDYAGTLGCPATDPLHASTTFETHHGIVVLRDELDRWAASRPVWNQHAYAVTHVGDRGQIPRSSAVAVNWRDPDLNNFRQNVQGDLEALGVPDLTARGEDGEVRVMCNEGGTGSIAVEVCNRGTLPMAAGTEVAFHEGPETGPELCRATVATAIEPGDCAEASCEAVLPTEGSIEITVLVDPDSVRDECLEGNNGTTLRVACTRLE